MSSVIQFAMEHKAELLGALFAVSEALSFIPAIKSNGIFQAVFNGLGKMLGKSSS